MARLKRTQSTAPDPREPLPEHTRTPEWRGLKQGDPVIVRLPGKKAKRGHHYQFSNHVVSPDGHEYIDVIEYRVGYGSGLWRSFPLDAVTPVPAPRPRRRRVTVA